MKYKEIRKNAIKSQELNILIVSTTEVETRAFHSVMSEEIYEVVIGDYTYYIGQVGKYLVGNVQCLNMGSINPGGSAQTIATALQEWPHIRAVIMMGICFGFDEKHQKIGDVIVSKSIRNYEACRIGETEEIPRGTTYEADACLCNAFNNLKFSWENIGIDGEKKKLVLGAYVSGEKLVDNKQARDSLHTKNPEAKAGEMEGNGMVMACKSARVAWIMVKAICDFADGNKEKDKENRQKIAAVASANCCAAVLEQETAFDSLGVCSGSMGGVEDRTKTESIDVLFELYKKEYEPYFLKRDIDALVESYISTHSLWIYGMSGVGKSTSILHAMLLLNKKFLLINMAGIAPQSSTEEAFIWIYNEVAGFVGAKTQVPDSNQLCIKCIISLLDEYFAGKEIYLLVEEIPFTGETFGKFVASFSSLVISDKLTGKSADVHFVLSSIENPLLHVQTYQQKIKSMMKFLEFGKWTEQECCRLIDLIKKYITIPAINNSSEMIGLCNNLPRPIKMIFREVYQTGFSEELDTEKIKIILTRQ